MLVQDGSNRNHYQAAAAADSVNISSSTTSITNNTSFSPLQSSHFRNDPHHHQLPDSRSSSIESVETSWKIGIVNNQQGGSRIQLVNNKRHSQNHQAPYASTSSSSCFSAAAASSSSAPLVGCSVVGVSVVGGIGGIAAESDSVNNNSHNRNNNNVNDDDDRNGGSGHDQKQNSSSSNIVSNTSGIITSYDNDVVKISPKNDNEILSEPDLVASINLSLSNLSKVNKLPTASATSAAGSGGGGGGGGGGVKNSSNGSNGNGVCVSGANNSYYSSYLSGGGSGGGGSCGGGRFGETKVITTNNPLVITTEKMSDAYLSGLKPDSLRNNNNNLFQGPLSAPNTPETMRKHQMLLRQQLPILSHSMIVPHVSSAKKEKMEFNTMMMKMNERDIRPLSYHGRSYESTNSSPNILLSNNTGGGGGGGGGGWGTPVNKRHVGSASSATRSRKEATLYNRRSMPSPYLENRFREKFDVSALDTNLPRIDLEAIENHLRLAREEERKRRSDREEIRRRLALESEDVNEKPSGRKPSLHSRLQSSMNLSNLQICFMNETASDSESPNSDTEAKHQPASLPHVKAQSGHGNISGGLPGGAPTEDFYARQARLQAEARQALSQAKEMARLQMAQEKEQRLTSPITDMVKNSLMKVGVTLPPERRRVSRQLLTEMNVAQLQVIVNDLHTHIEVLNETLVSMLLDRDDLHMEQDSMLVDVEDLSRYLAAKDNSSPHASLPLIVPSRSLLGKK